MSQRILVVEDNKTLAKLISKKIGMELDFEVDVAFNFAEAKLFLKRYDYFLTLLDLNLPDAPNGEIVDYALENKNKVIVLSANIDKSFRTKILQKNIIDYVNKGGVNDINYIIQTIKRVQKNKSHKILVVDDSMVFRRQMQDMLENMFFKVITVAHGEEALGILSTTPDISLVLTDYHMPVINGLELTQEIRKEHTKNDLGIIVVSGDSNDEVTALFLKNGANDYIKKPFSKEEFYCRINNSIEALENIHQITNYANRDFLTGLYNRRYFFENAQRYFEHALQSSENFALAIVDIDGFKHINDTYGNDIGDRIINKVADILRTNTDQDDIVARFSVDEFYILIKNTSPQSALDMLDDIRESVQDSSFAFENSKEIKITVSVGAALRGEDSLDETINSADMLLYNAKQSGRNNVVHN